MPAAEVRPARALLKPGEVRKRRLTVAEAADQYERSDDALAALAEKAAPLKAARDDAEEVLLAHFERTGRSAYKDRIAWKWSGGSLILDQDKVRKYLGAKLKDFQTRSKKSRKLTRLNGEQ